MTKLYQGSNLLSSNFIPLSEEQYRLLNSIKYKVDKEGDKGLSTNDFTDEYKNKVDAFSRYIGHFNNISDRDNYSGDILKNSWCSIQVDEDYSNKETKYVYNGTNWVFNGYYDSTTLEFDDKPTEESSNLLTSGVIYDNCIKDNNIKTYSDVTQLGLPSITSVTEIFNAMEDNSLGMFECNGIVSDTPAQYGLLIIEKKSISRFNLLFKLSSQDEVLDNVMYVGNLKGSDGTGLVWNKIISSNMISNTFSSDLTNEQLLSAKCIYDSHISTGGIIEENTDWNTLTTGTYRVIKDRTYVNSLFDTFPNEYPYGDLIVSKSGLIWMMMYIPNGGGLKDDSTPYESNVIVMAGKDTGEAGTWFKLANYNDLKKRIEDTSWVTKTASSTNFSKGNVYHRVKDGICDVYIENLTIGSSGVSAGTVICSGLPTPELSMWTSIARNDGIKSMLVKPNMNGDLVTYTVGEGSYYDHFTYIVKEN